MVVRHRAIAFAAGALVFPGGKVDLGDADGAWGMLAPVSATRRCARGYVAAAARGFEEAGLMLARWREPRTCFRRPRRTSSSIDTARQPDRRQDFLPRHRVRRERLELATDLMVPFAHWITPEGVPKRFDTHFLLVAAPVNQLGAHDGGRSIEGLWIRPQQALAEAEAGARTLVFATQMNLTKLARYATVAEAVAAARASPVVTVTPQVERHSPAGAAGLEFRRKRVMGVSEIVVTAPAGHAAGLNRRAVSGLVALLAALGNDVEKADRLTVDEFDVGRKARRRRRRVRLSPSA